MVFFEAAKARYCVPVEAARGVRTTDTLVALPSTDTDIAGIMPGNPALTVLSPLRAVGPHVLVLESGGITFGLLVDTVSGVRRVDDRDIGGAPLGPEQTLVCGTLESMGHLVLVADPAYLAKPL